MQKLYKSFLTKTMWVAVLIFSVRCLFSWTNIFTNFDIYEIYGFAGESISLTAIIMFAYERHLWKYNPWESIPVLSKVYTGIIKSSYDSIERPAKLEIKQTLLSIHVTLTSGESKSKSLSASINEILGEKQLIYCYLNTPQSECRHRSEVHYGTAMICVDEPKKLQGQYYTDRETIGDMFFTPADK